MAPLTLFRRQWSFGSDDLTNTSLWGILFHGFLLAGCVLQLGQNRDDSQWHCERIYSVAGLGVAGSMLLLFLMLLSMTNRGSILEEEKRVWVAPLFGLIVILLVLELGFMGFGTYVLFIQMKSEDVDSTTVFNRIVLISMWSYLVLFFLSMRISMSNRRLGTRKRHHHHHHHHRQDLEQPFIVDHESDSEGMSWSATRFDWEARMKRLVCCFRYATCGLFSGDVHETSDDIFRHVANVQARVWKGLHLVPTDVIAATALLRAEQLAHEKQTIAEIVQGGISTPEMTAFAASTSWLWSGSNVNETARFRSQYVDETHLNLDEETKRVLKEFDHFSPYMKGIYGKLLATFEMHPPCRLMCPCLGKSDAQVINDDCCSLNFGALRINSADRIDSTIVFASFTNKPHQSPYAIAIDQETKTVVLCIRGSLSASDILIDAMIMPVSPKDAAKKWKFEHLITDETMVHSGVLETVMWMRQDIENRKILHTLLKGYKPEYGDELKHLPDCVGYNFRILGHSLGAGISSLISLALLDQFPDLRVLSYSPPGFMFTHDLAERTESWIDTVFLSSDFAPLLNWQTLIKLRGQILDMLRRCKVNKATAIRSLLLNTPPHELLYSEDQVPATPAREEVKAKITQLHQQTTQSENPLCKYPLHCPGKIYQLLRIEKVQKHCCKRQDVFIPIRIKDRRTLDEVRVSRHLLMDHLPDLVAKVLHQQLEFQTRNESLL